jgi:hypothetical protein
VGADEEHLVGNVGGAVRIGDTVHRPVGPWTPAVHALLAHLAQRGLPHIPHVRGVDGHGREVLDYLPGNVVDSPATLLSPGQLAALVTWTRAFHDAVADFRHDGPWRYFPIPAATLIGHNDIAPYNACFDGDRLSGVFDWDLAGPTTPLDELAFIAWNCVPLHTDVGAAVAAERLQLIADAYGGPSAGQILQHAPARITVLLDGIPVAAAGGDQGMANLMALGEPDRSRASHAQMCRRLPLIAAHL